MRRSQPKSVDQLMAETILLVLLVGEEVGFKLKHTLGSKFKKLIIIGEIFHQTEELGGSL